MPDAASSEASELEALEALEASGATWKYLLSLHNHQ